MSKKCAEVGRGWAKLRRRGRKWGGGSATLLPLLLTFSHLLALLFPFRALKMKACYAAYSHTDVLSRPFSNWPLLWLDGSAAVLSGSFESFGVRLRNGSGTRTTVNKYDRNVKVKFRINIWIYNQTLAVSLRPQAFIFSLMMRRESRREKNTKQSTNQNKRRTARCLCCL